MNENRWHRILTERMKTGPDEPWFDPNVAQEDHFVAPDLALSQFFFSRRTAMALADALDDYASPCCLCTPRLAAEWAQRGRDVTLLDIDGGFAKFPGFQQYDLRVPVAATQDFDALIVDPPFFIPEPVQHAIDTLCGDRRPDLFLVFAVEYERELLQRFSEYRLQPTTFDVRHNHVKASHQSLFRLYASRPELFAPECIALRTTPAPATTKPAPAEPERA